MSQGIYKAKAILDGTVTERKLSLELQEKINNRVPKDVTTSMVHDDYNRPEIGDPAAPYVKEILDTISGKLVAISDRLEECDEVRNREEQSLTAARRIYGWDINYATGQLLTFPGATGTNLDGPISVMITGELANYIELAYNMDDYTGGPFSVRFIQDVRGELDIYGEIIYVYGDLIAITDVQFINAAPDIVVTADEYYRILNNGDYFDIPVQGLHLYEGISYRLEIVERLVDGYDPSVIVVPLEGWDSFAGGTLRVAYVGDEFAYRTVFNLVISSSQIERRVEIGGSGTETANLIPAAGDAELLTSAQESMGNKSYVFGFTLAPTTGQFQLETPNPSSEFFSIYYSPLPSSIPWTSLLISEDPLTYSVTYTPQNSDLNSASMTIRTEYVENDRYPTQIAVLYVGSHEVAGIRIDPEESFGHELAVGDILRFQVTTNSTGTPSYEMDPTMAQYFTIDEGPGWSQFGITEFSATLFARVVNPLPTSTIDAYFRVYMTDLSPLSAVTHIQAVGIGDDIPSLIVQAAPYYAPIKVGDSYTIPVIGRNLTNEIELSVPGALTPYVELTKDAAWNNLTGGTLTLTVTNLPTNRLIDVISVYSGDMSETFEVGFSGIYELTENPNFTISEDSPYDFGQVEIGDTASVVVTANVDSTVVSNGGYITWNIEPASTVFVRDIALLKYTNDDASQIEMRGGFTPTQSGEYERETTVRVYISDDDRYPFVYPFIFTGRSANASLEVAPEEYENLAYNGSDIPFFVSADGLSGDIGFSFSDTTYFTVSPDSDWNTRTGGTLLLTPVTEFEGTLSFTLTVTSASDGLVTNVPITIQYESALRVNRNKIIDDEFDYQNSGHIVQVTGLNLTDDITYTLSSNLEGILTVTPGESWDPLLGGTLYLQSTYNFENLVGTLTITSGTHTQVVNINLTSNIEEQYTWRPGNAQGNAVNEEGFIRYTRNASESIELSIRHPKSRNIVPRGSSTSPTIVRFGDISRNTNFPSLMVYSIPVTVTINPSTIFQASISIVYDGVALNDYGVTIRAHRSEAGINFTNAAALVGNNGIASSDFGTIYAGDGGVNKVITVLIPTGVSPTYNVVSISNDYDLGGTSGTNPTDFVINDFEITQEGRRLTLDVTFITNDSTPRTSQRNITINYEDSQYAVRTAYQTVIRLTGEVDANEELSFTSSDYSNLSYNGQNLTFRATGSDLQSDIIYQVEGNSNFTLSPGTGWNPRTGGPLILSPVGEPVEGTQQMTLTVSTSRGTTASMSVTLFYTPSISISPRNAAQSWDYRTSSITFTVTGFNLSQNMSVKAYVGSSLTEDYHFQINYASDFDYLHGGEITMVGLWNFDGTYSAAVLAESGTYTDRVFANLTSTVQEVVTFNPPIGDPVSTVEHTTGYGLVESGLSQDIEISIEHPYNVMNVNNITTNNGNLTRFTNYTSQNTNPALNEFKFTVGTIDEMTNNYSRISNLYLQRDGVNDTSYKIFFAGVPWSAWGEITNLSPTIVDATFTDESKFKVDLGEILIGETQQISFRWRARLTVQELTVQVDEANLDYDSTSSTSAGDFSNFTFTPSESEQWGVFTCTWTPTGTGDYTSTRTIRIPMVSADIISAQIPDPSYVEIELTGEVKEPRITVTPTTTTDNFWDYRTGEIVIDVVGENLQEDIEIDWSLGPNSSIVPVVSVTKSSNWNNRTGGRVYVRGLTNFRESRAGYLEFKSTGVTATSFVILSTTGVNEEVTINGSGKLTTPGNNYSYAWIASAPTETQGITFTATIDNVYYEDVDDWTVHFITASNSELFGFQATETGRSLENGTLTLTLNAGTTNFPTDSSTQGVTPHAFNGYVTIDKVVPANTSNLVSENTIRTTLFIPAWNINPATLTTISGDHAITTTLPGVNDIDFVDNTPTMIGDTTSYRLNLTNSIANTSLEFLRWDDVTSDVTPGDGTVGEFTYTPIEVTDASQIVYVGTHEATGGAWMMSTVTWRVTSHLSSTIFDVGAIISSDTYYAVAPRIQDGTWIVNPSITNMPHPENRFRSILWGENVRVDGVGSPLYTGFFGILEPGSALYGTGVRVWFSPDGIQWSQLSYTMSNPIIDFVITHSIGSNEENEILVITDITTSLRISVYQSLSTLNTSITNRTAALGMLEEGFTLMKHHPNLNRTFILDYNNSRYISRERQGTSFTDYTITFEGTTPYTTLGMATSNSAASIYYGASQSARVLHGTGTGSNTITALNWTNQPSSGSGTKAVSGSGYNWILLSGNELHWAGSSSLTSPDYVATIPEGFASLKWVYDYSNVWGGGDHLWGYVLRKDGKMIYGLAPTINNPSYTEFPTNIALDCTTLTFSCKGDRF